MTKEKQNTRKYGKSKIMAWSILAVATILTAYSISKELEGVATAIWSTGIPSAVGLYASKQFQDRKWAEITTKEKENGCT